MATGTVSSISGDNWQFIAGGVTPIAGSQSLTFSSIAGYKTIMVVLNGISSSTTEALYLQFNGDTTAGDYFYNNPGVQLGRTVTTTAQGRMAIIHDVNKSVPHKVETNAGSAADATYAFNYWCTPDPITSITVAFTATATFAATGTITIYGIAA